MRRTKEEAEETRQLLLKTALTVFGRRGYTSTTLEDLAKEAGVTRGAIYWHFGGKAELYNALLAEYAGYSSAIVHQAVAEGGSLSEIIRRIFVRQLEAVAHDPALRAMMEITLFKTERTPELLAGTQQNLENNRVLLTSIAEAMRQGIASGELRNEIEPIEMARAFLALQNGAIYLWLADPSSFSLSASAPALAEIYLRGILAR